MYLPGKRVGYTLYLLVAVSLCLYILFPGDIVRNHINSHTGHLLAPYQLEIEQVKPAFPPGVRLQGISLRHNQRELLQLAPVRVSPVYAALLEPGQTFEARAAPWGGHLNSRLNFTADRGQATMTAHTTLNAVALENIPELERISGRALSGRLSGKVVWDSSQSAEPVTADLTVADGRVELLVPWLAIDRVDFQQIDTVLSLNRQQLSVRRCIFVGKQIKGSLSGSIQWRYPLGESLLILNGVIRLQPDFARQLQSKLPEGFVLEENKNDGYRVRFGGTLDKPMFSLK